MEAKHSLEKQTAAYVDCFTTVSEITSRECKFLLGKAPDVVTPNGFEQSFVPTGETFEKKRREARAMLIKIAERLLGCSIQPDAFIISTSGRYEYRNKGLDIFIDAMNCLRMSPEKMKNETIAFIMTPAWTIAPRADLQYLAEHSINQDEPLQIPFITHWIHEMENDRILNYIQQKGFSPEQAPKIIFIPCYLTGNDGLFNSSYYDLLPAMDMTVYPSYYEPWGYTPQESIAFGIPAVTTDLAGFGLWAESQGAGSNINQGVKIIRRTDENYFQAAEEIAQAIISLMSEKKSEREKISVRCRQLAQKTGWEQFISYYEQAYSIALRKASERMN
jgi:glycosyltransferase involved in cell wall biosynthesis